MNLLGYAFDGLEFVSLPLPFWTWQVIGAAAFFSSVLIIVFAATTRGPSESDRDDGDVAAATPPLAPSVKFYPDRDAVVKARGGIVDELKSCTRVWAWYTGTHAALGDIFKATPKLKRLVLLESEGKNSQRHAAILDQPYEQFKQDIQATVDKAHEAGVEVIFVDAPETLMLIAEPESRGGWIRIEIVIPGSTERPSIVIEEATDPKRFHEFVEGFKSMTEHAVRVNP